MQQLQQQGPQRGSLGSSSGGGAPPPESSHTDTLLRSTTVTSAIERFGGAPGAGARPPGLARRATQGSGGGGQLSYGAAVPQQRTSPAASSSSSETRRWSQQLEPAALAPVPMVSGSKFGAQGVLGAGIKGMYDEMEREQQRGKRVEKKESVRDVGELLGEERRPKVEKRPVQQQPAAPAARAAAQPPQMGQVSSKFEFALKKLECEPLVALGFRRLL